MATSSHIPATREEIAHVLSSPSEITIAELRANGLEPSDACAVLQGRLVTDETLAFLEDGTPLGVFGLSHVGKGRLSTWFVCTQRFFDAGSATLFPARRLINDVRRRHPGVEIRARTWSKKSCLERWFLILGFRHEAFGDDHRVFRLA